MLSNSNVTSARHHHCVRARVCVCARSRSRACTRATHARHFRARLTRARSFCFRHNARAWCSCCAPLALRLALTLWVFIMDRHRGPFSVYRGRFRRSAAVTSGAPLAKDRPIAGQISWFYPSDRTSRARAHRVSRTHRAPMIWS